MTTAPNGAPRRGRRKRVDPGIKRKADELHKSGLPYQMAMAIAHGQMDLNEALERMARRDQVTKLMERHDLSRALATQVVIGHADLGQVLARRRLEEHRDENRDRTVLVEGTEVTLGLCGRRTARGSVRNLTAYTVEVGTGDDFEEIHKLQIKYAHAPSIWKGAKKAIRSDKVVAKSPLEPQARPQDRYSCSDRRLFTYVDSQREIVVTLIEGEVIRGVVTWFGRYEFCIQSRKGIEIVVFRHALHHIEEA